MVAGVSKFAPGFGRKGRVCLSCGSYSKSFKNFNYFFLFGREIEGYIGLKVI